MYNLLKTRGYKGRKNIGDVIRWLQKNQIYIDFRTVWDKDGSGVIGYRATVFFKPYNSSYSTPVYTTFDGALEFIVYKLTDYLPKNSTL